MLDLAEPAEVFVQLAAVGGAEGPADPPGVLADEVEDALATPGVAVGIGAGRPPGGVPKRRSKTRRGLICLATGVASPRHERFDW